MVLLKFFSKLIINNKLWKQAVCRTGKRSITSQVLQEEPFTRRYFLIQDGFHLFCFVGYVKSSKLSKRLKWDKELSYVAKTGFEKWKTKVITKEALFWIGRKRKIQKKILTTTITLTQISRDERLQPWNKDNTLGGKLHDEPWSKAYLKAHRALLQRGHLVKLRFQWIKHMDERWDYEKLKAKGIAAGTLVHWRDNESHEAPWSNSHLWNRMLEDWCALWLKCWRNWYRLAHWRRL